MKLAPNTAIEAIIFEPGYIAARQVASVCWMRDVLADGTLAECIDEAGAPRSSKEKGSALGLCSRHYQQQRRDPTRIGLIKKVAARGKTANATFRIGKDQAAKLKALAVTRTAIAGREVSVGELLREAIDRLVDAEVVAQ